MGSVGKLGVRLSVIVTTYNNPRALSLCLACLARQTITDLEMLVADDGSGPPTRIVVEEFASSAPFPVHHIWHPDEGFRKSTILNRAILTARGDYLIFFDGDLLATSRCIERHVAAIERNCYLTGGAIDLLEPVASTIEVNGIRSGVLDRLGIVKHVSKPRRVILSHVPGIRHLMDRWVPREPAWRGGQSSGFKEHLLNVDGFDERFTYGYEDADLGHRLQASGVRGKSVRYSCPVFHLDHPRPYSNRDQLAANKALYDQNRLTGVIGTRYGIRRES